MTKKHKQSSNPSSELSPATTPTPTTLTTIIPTTTTPTTTTPTTTLALVKTTPASKGKKDGIKTRKNTSNNNNNNNNNNTVWERWVKGGGGRGGGKYIDFQDSLGYYLLLICILVVALAFQRLHSVPAKIAVLLIACCVCVAFIYFKILLPSRSKSDNIPEWLPTSQLPDLVKSNWCKNAIIQTSPTSCCVIFDYIMKLQRDRCEPWGTVLDAGTGNHSLSWICDLPNCTSWTAITGSDVRAKSMRADFKDRMRKNDEIIFGNWLDENLLQGRVYDVVVADYLLGSIDGFAPYFQDQLFSRLKPHVGKYLYFVGMDPLPEKADTPHGQLIIEIAKLRDACILLAGHRTYREYPLDWTLKHMVRAGFKVTNVANFETAQSRSFVETQLDVADAKLELFKDRELAEQMSQHIEKLRKKIYSMKWGITFGGDYVIAAEI